MTQESPVLKIEFAEAANNLDNFSADAIHIPNSDACNYTKEHSLINEEESPQPSSGISPGRSFQVLLNKDKNVNQNLTLFKNTIKPSLHLKKNAEDKSLSYLSDVLENNSPLNNDNKERAFEFMEGLNFLQIFLSSQITRECKGLILLTTWTFLLSLGINSAELYVYTNSLCDEDQGFAFCVFLNFFCLILLKIYALSATNKSLMLETSSKNPASFLVPFSFGGFFTLLQFPQMTYDYETCQERSSIFSRTYVIRFSLLLGAAILLIFSWTIIKLTFYLFESNLLSCKCPRLRSIKIGIYVLATLIAYAQTILIGLTQAKWWIANLFIEYTTIAVLGLFTSYFAFKSWQMKRGALKPKSLEISLRVV